jgi:hypothetical protein
MWSEMRWAGGITNLRVSCRKSVAAVSLLRGATGGLKQRHLVQSFYTWETNARRLMDFAGDERGRRRGWRHLPGVEVSSVVLGQLHRSGR